MAGPAQATTQITEGAGKGIGGFTNSFGSFSQAMADSSNAFVTGVFNAASTSGTSGQTVEIDCDGHGVGLITYDLTNTISTGVVTFEVYDGTRWRFVRGMRIDGTYAEITYALSGPSMAWHFNIKGFKKLRVRLSQALTTASSGTASFGVTVQAGSISPLVMANLLTALAFDKDTITAYPKGGTYTNISTNTTTVLKFTAGVLFGLVAGDPGTAWQADVYDNTATGGAKIATIKFPLTVPFPPTAFATGCTIVTSGTTPGNLTAVVI